MDKNKSYKNKISQLITNILVGLIIFLPLSSWLVSITGILWISLIRDFLVVIIFVLSIASWIFDCKNWKRLILPGLFIIWGLLSFFWKEESIGQWARGFRYYFVPIILYCSLIMVNFNEKQKKFIFKAILSMGLVIAGLALLELIGVKLPLTSKFSGIGALKMEHYVGSLKVLRLQSILAGPNALGLYFVALISCCLGAFRYFTKKIYWLLPIFSVGLILTYSRSAILGGIMISLVALGRYLFNRFGTKKALLVISVLTILFGSLGFIAFSNSKTKDYFLHYDSNYWRKVQYERVWSDREKIGLLGKGVGSAGLSTQYQLNGTDGENRWTENTYLDIFEQLGLIGALLFIASILSAIWYSLRSTLSFESESAFYGLLGFAVSGLFVSMYTGQVGIYLVFILAGLAVSKMELERT